jgi:UDP-N-acetylmuramoyl-tripeptide--D-alanyl-D-alanine ligase
MAPVFLLSARLVVRIRAPLIIGVTGSVGKTTTTEMISAVLASPGAQRLVGPIGKSSENMNDDVGLPLAILQYDDWLVWRLQKLVATFLAPWRALTLAFLSRYPKVLVLEYGTHWKGHLHRLAKLAPPKIAVVTAIGPAHLDRLKSLEGVAEEKGALVSAVPPSGLVILGVGHSYVSHLERKARAPVLKVEGRGVELSRNIAIAIGRHLRVPEEDITSALGAFKPAHARLNRLTFAELTVIDDTYNANPLSMRLGLDVLAETAGRAQRRVAILGAMRELGEDGARHHAEVSAYAKSRTDLLIGVGDLAKYYEPDHWFESNQGCVDRVGELIRPGDCVLVKGSRSVRLEWVVERLREIGEGRRVWGRRPG